MVGKLNSDVLHDPADLAAGLAADMRAVAVSDGKWEGTVTRMRRDGSMFTARVVLTPRRNAQGDPVGFLLISKDISSEIRLTEELEATQFYTRSLIESNIDALMTTDPVGAITDVNQQMEWLTGRTREELIGSPFKQYFTDADRAEDGIRQALREGKVTNYELTARAKDGRETVVSYNATTFNDREGKLQGVFAAAPRRHRAQGAGGAAAPVRVLQPGPDRGVRRRAHRGQCRWPDLRCQRPDVPDVGIQRR